MQLPPKLASWLASEGHDAVHVSSIGFERAADSLIFEEAVRQGRIVITADLDYARLVAQSASARPGIVLLRGGAFNETEAKTRIAAVLRLFDEQTLSASIVVVGPKGIRKRDLPIL
jgi:predicted nuclease of predicted toxin-antitoxin system